MPITKASSSHGHSRSFCSGARDAGEPSGSGEKPGCGVLAVAVLAGVGRSRFALEGGGGASAGDEGRVAATSGARFIERRSAVLEAGADVLGCSSVVVAGWVRVRAGAVVAGVSAGLVGVPPMLKFDSSRGPIESVAGVFVVGAGAVCASRDAGASASPAETIAIPMRETALITFRSCA